MIKSDYSKVCNNLAKAFDYAREAAQIAEKCQFHKDIETLREQIHKLQIYPEDPINDSGALVAAVLGIQTTTDGNLESNAAGMTDRGIFSTDDSELECIDALREVIVFMSGKACVYRDNFCVTIFLSCRM